MGHPYGYSISDKLKISIENFIIVEIISLEAISKGLFDGPSDRTAEHAISKDQTDTFTTQSSLQNQSFDDESNTSALSSDTLDTFSTEMKQVKKHTTKSTGRRPKLGDLGKCQSVEVDPGRTLFNSRCNTTPSQ